MIDNGVEYALYFIALNHPHIMREAEKFQSGMLCNRRSEEQRVKDLIGKHYAIHNRKDQER